MIPEQPGLGVTEHQRACALWVERSEEEGGQAPGTEADEGNALRAKGVHDEDNIIASTRRSRPTGTSECWVRPRSATL